MAAESGFELPTDYYANQRLAQWNGSRGQIHFRVNDDRSRSGQRARQQGRDRANAQRASYWHVNEDAARSRARSVGQRQLSAKGWVAALSGLSFYPVLSLMDIYMKQRALRVAAQERRFQRQRDVLVLYQKD